jgi:predicted RNA-binding protein YlqC (UPF0109 family)
MSKELVETIARALVDEPDAVEVNAVDREDAVVFELTVAPDDIGKVIGRQGRTIKALRTLLHAASIKSQRRAELEVME